jgi:hypothetical protein
MFVTVDFNGQQYEAEVQPDYEGDPAAQYLVNEILTICDISPDPEDRGVSGADLRALHGEIIDAARAGGDEIDQYDAACGN